MKEQSLGNKVFKVCNALLMLIVVLVTVLPYVHILAKAFNEGNDTMMGGILFWPRKFTLENIKTLLRDSSMYTAFFVTLARVIIGCALGIFIQFMTGYALSNKDLPGRKWVTLLFIIPMCFTGGLIPQYTLYSKVNLMNSFWVYILPSLFVFYNVLIIKSYIGTTIPESLKEAARIDGMGEFALLFKIIVPLSMPIIATVLLWIAVAHWNDWTTTLYFVNKPTLQTLQYKLMQVIKESERLQKLQSEAAIYGASANQTSKSTPDALISAQIFVTTVPIIIVYPFLQKYFVMGVTLGAVKE